MSTSNHHVGVLGIEVYFPSTYVTQEDLEVQNDCKGKYTQGLGQDAMAFCGDREDINSIALTVVNNLMLKYNISPSKVGRLEIGTETLLDKSKSTKTVLMELFAQSGNTDIEGVTTINACYGGTAALLNSLTWIDSSSWDGRFAIVVAADIAVYADGPARPTGGCGAVALLLGRDAPLPINLRSRTCHSSHVWDFFKPKLDSEYPEVNGALSQTCYLRALDDCYQRFVAKQFKDTYKEFGLQQIDEFLFHSPYNKLVQKSFNRLVYLDMMENKLPNSDIQKWLNVPIASTYEDKELEAKLKSAGSPLYNAKVAIGCGLSKQIGNTYTASLYMNLAQLVSAKGASLVNKRIALFSYGSGAMASLFEILPRVPTQSSSAQFSLQRIQEVLDISSRLINRQKMTPDDLANTLELREFAHGATPPFYPRCSTENLYPGTFFLETVTKTFERKYTQKPRTATRVEVSMVGANSKDSKHGNSNSLVKPASDEEEEDDMAGGITMDTFDEDTPTLSSKQRNNGGVSSSRSNNRLVSPSSSPRINSFNRGNNGNLTGSTSSSGLGMPRNQTMVWASGKLNVQVVVTGVAAALPGRGKPLIINDGESNIQRIINGENFISPIPPKVMDAMIEKNVVEIVKTKDGKTVKHPITKYEETINLCASIGDYNMKDYGVSESIASTMDQAVQVAIIAGLEALKHAGIVDGVGPDGWVLPASMQNTTGVVFATSFPALDTAIAEVSKYYESKDVQHQRARDIVDILKAKFVARTEDGVLSAEVEQALSALVNELTTATSTESSNKSALAREEEREQAIKPYEFDRKFLFRVLVLGNAQLAQIIKARGPNMQTNAACAGATQAIALAYDMIQVGRAERVIVVAGDNASSDTLMPWLGNGFRALGAATICSDVRQAAQPFNQNRSGMILGSGGIGLVLESEEGAKRRFFAKLNQQRNGNGSSVVAAPVKQRTAPFCCRLLGTLISNSAYHGASMDKDHIASEMERFIASIEKEQMISRSEIAQHGVYFSHETSTHASPTSSCSYNELYGLRKTFGADFKHLMILNTKGFTGHPMGVSFEDVVAAEVLSTGFIPPIANFTTVDPALVVTEGDIKMSGKGGHYPCKYALRFAAGFGSQVALALYGVGNHHE